MKMRESFSVALVIIAAAIVLVASAAITAYTTDERKPQMTAHPQGEGIQGSGSVATKDVLWDNGMDYQNLLTAQIESDPSGIISEPADDFQFDADQVVSDVHWIGGYYNGPPVDGDFDWQITFYNDFGDGTKPGTVINTWVFPNADVNETWIEDIYMGACYSYSVDLPTPLNFSADTKYWISIQGIGDTYPQSGWGYHDSPILLHQAVLRSEYFGYPDWTDLSQIFGYSLDMCFQLTGEPFSNHKMHFPQLPDLIGWDVMATNPVTLADDWQCSFSGLVTEIHFWGSWKDQDGIPETDDVGQIQYFQFGIWSNLPVGHPQNPFPYSIPGTLLWSREEWVPGTPYDPPTLEAWYDPWVPEVIPNDHIPYWQYDFVDISDPFVQQVGSIYWLSISAVLDDPQNFQWGWKNSRDHFEDDAVFMDPTGQWVEMYEPPRYNEFTVEFGPGFPVSWGGTNFYGDGFYRYESWWNMWFYDNPFTYDQPKVGVIEFMVDPIGPEPWLLFAINWSTDLWSLEGVPGRPPLPGEDETLYIGREIIGALEPMGFYVFPIEILPYNPEWISVDFMASDVVITGLTYHECVGTSLDLAFVIGGPECIPSIDVEKKVWDEENQEWVDYVDIDSGEIAEFSITITNDGTCCDLYFNVYDWLHSSFEFWNANPYPDDITSDPPWGTYLYWYSPITLSPGDGYPITLYAKVIGPPCHIDTNYVAVEGYCETLGQWVYDEDLAFVHSTQPVICGDVNADGIVNVGDIVYLVSYLYRGGPAPIPQSCVGDVNNDDIVNVGDIVYLVSYLYRGGPAPDPNCCNPPWK